MKSFSPSLILATPGCWAWDKRGALLAGVFCGVLKAKFERSVAMYARPTERGQKRRRSEGAGEAERASRPDAMLQ